MSEMSKDLALFILRLSGAGLAYAHGWSKVQGLAAGESSRFIEGVANLGFPAPTFFAWAAALTEFGGGLLIALGLLSRFVAPVAAFNMFVAAFLRHKAHLHLLNALGIQSVPEETLKQSGNPEMALLYLACFLAIFLLGPGRFALDQLLGRASKGKR